MRNAIRLGAITLVWILNGANPASGQSDSPLAVPLVASGSDSPIRPTSNYREGLIHLDVSIADGGGKAIAGLDLSDIKLLDNGKPAKILTLRPAYPPDVNARLTEVALVLDELDSPRPMIAEAKSDLLKYLQQNNGILSQLTSVYRLRSNGFYASAPTTDGNGLARDLARDSFSRPIWRGLGLPQPAEGAGNMGNWSKALRSVYALAVNWREQPGRKALVWIGPGWPVNGYISGHENPFPLLVELLSRIREARMVIYQAFPWAESRNDEFAYTAFANGVRSSSELGQHMQYFAVQVIALESGGMVLDEGGSVAGDIAKCVHDAGLFYTLSFDPPHAAEVDEYHDLKARVAKPGATARTNTGYYDQPVFYDQPRIAAQRVTVQQLESTLERDDKEHDGELAAQLKGMVLTERLSSSKLALWLRQIRGKQSREALIVLADESVYLDPPAAEIAPSSAPDYTSQVRMLRRTVQYLNEILPRLPDFYAIRTLVEYDPREREDSPWKTASVDQSLHEWVTEKSTLLYRQGREEQIVHKRKEKSSLKRDLSFIGIFGPILHRVLRDAMVSNGLSWSRWESGEQGNEAVFRYAVHSDHPRYEVDSCCLRNGDSFRTDPEYHGELAIDPQTGTILRLTMQAEPGWIVEPNLTPIQFVRATGMMLEYGPMQIGGKTFICPRRSVVTIRTRAVRSLNFWGQHSTVYAPYLSMMDDIAFSDYHKFGSESRILPGFDVVQDQKPGETDGQSPKTPVSH